MSDTVTVATTSRLLLSLARLDVTADVYRRLADADPLVGRDALQHENLVKIGPSRAPWVSRLRCAYSTIVTRDGSVFVHATTSWYLNDRDHRDWDLPSVLYSGGGMSWFRNGECHRDGDLPAHVDDDTKEWLRNGEYHRDGDKPAVERRDGSKEWYVARALWTCGRDPHFHRWRDGEEHRDGDEPAIIRADGDREWYRHGKRHRDGDKPAVVEADGTKWWYRDGKHHRDGDKPAYETADGYREWWHDGVQVRIRRLRLVV